jgi:hypothetical protein
MDDDAPKQVPKFKYRGSLFTEDGEKETRQYSELNKKTEVAVCSKDPENMNIKMDEDAPKQVSKFKYPGSIFTEDGEKETRLNTAN